MEPEYHKKWRKKNKNKIKKANKSYYSNNKEVYQKWYKKNKSKIKKQRQQYIANKRTNNEIFKFKEDIKTLIRMSFNRKSLKKNIKSNLILGCSIKEFREYIESKFEPWMNWNNRGNPKDGILELNKTWDLDHIIPLSTAKTKEDIIRLNHYTNFQPMCSYTNRYIKSDNV